MWVIDGDGGESEQRAEPEATAAAGSDWCTSQLWNTHSYSLSQPSLSFSLSLSRSRPAPLAWTVAEAVALAPELGPLATEESPRHALCQGLLIWAR